MKSNLSKGVLAGIVIASCFSSVFAAEAVTQKQTVEDRPQVQQGELPEPVVTIRSTDESTIKEYRVNGVLRAIKITPKNGFPAYYLVDREGAGEFVRMGPDVGKQLSTPQWIFFTW